MQDHLFEYAVIRVVPRVEREEFVNAGVILYCRDRNFLQAMFTIDEHRLCALCKTLDITEIKKHLLSFEEICKGAPDGARCPARYCFPFSLAHRPPQYRSTNIAGASR